MTSFKTQLIFYLLFVAVTSWSQNKDLQYYYRQGQEAYKSKAYPKFYEMMSEAHKLHPYHQGILYQLGMAAALTGRKEEALLQLKRAILIDANFKLNGLADFNAIKDTPRFRSLLELQKEYQRPVIHSDTAFSMTAACTPKVLTMIPIMIISIWAAFTSEK